MKKLPYNKKVFKKGKKSFIVSTLFFDTPQVRQYGVDERACFSLYEDEDVTVDGKTYYSLRKIFLSCSDPTEYVFASTYLYSWDHWLKMLENKIVSIEVEKWREELQVKIRAEAVAKCLEASEGGNFNAAKWVATKGWENKRGRPTRAEKEGKLNQDKRLSNQVKEDMERLGMAVVK